MAVVAKGLLNGEDLMKLYGGTGRKKCSYTCPQVFFDLYHFLRKLVFIYLCSVQVKASF